MIHRGSQLGGCLKSQIATALGYKPIEPDEASATRMAQGELHERDVIATLQAEGWLVSDTQKEVDLHVCSDDDCVDGEIWVGGDSYDGGVPMGRLGPCTTGWTVQGHLDGIVTNPDELMGQRRVLEIKSMGRDVFKDFKAKGWDAPGLVQRYKTQISVYMLATGLEAYVVAKNRDSGELLRHGIEVPFYTLDEIADRVTYIEDHVARRVLPVECDRDWWCPHKYLCTHTETSQPDDEPTVDDAAFEGQLAAYIELSAAIKGLEAKRRALQPIIQAGLGDRIQARVGRYRVTWVTKTVAAHQRKESVQSYPKVTKIGEDDAVATP